MLNVNITTVKPQSAGRNYVECQYYNSETTKRGTIEDEGPARRATAESHKDRIRITAGSPAPAQKKIFQFKKKQKNVDQFNKK